MIYKELEMNYLVSLVRTALNNESAALQETGKSHDWGCLYRMAELHNVSVMAYYAVLGKNEGITKEWKEKFSERFRQGITHSEQQHRALAKVGRILGEAGIPMLLLPPAGIKCMYPQADMREVKDIYILSQKKEEKRLRNVLTEGGLCFEGRDDYGSMTFSTGSNVRFVFQTRLFAHNIRLKKPFKKIWETARQDQDFPALYYLEPDDQYLLLISWICDQFVFSRPGIRDVADLFVFLKNWDKRLNWTYLELKLTEYQIIDFAKEMKKLSFVWFDKGSEPPEGDKGYRILEECILSKGLQGLEGTSCLLPMITELKVCRLKSENRERFRKNVRWLFPEPSYMQAIDPILKDVPFLLPLCWIKRLASLVFSRIKLGVKKVYLKLYLKINRCRGRMRRFFSRKSRHEPEEPVPGEPAVKEANQQPDGFPEDVYTDDYNAMKGLVQSDEDQEESTAAKP